MFEFFFIEKSSISYSEILKQALLALKKRIILLNDVNLSRDKINKDLKKCLLIATSPDMLALGLREGIPTILLCHPNSDRLQLQKKFKPIYTCDSESELADLLRYIENLSVNELYQINREPHQSIINVKSLKEAEQKIIGDNLFPVYQTLLQGRTQESFVSQFTDSRPDHLNVLIFTNKIGKPVGFIIVGGHEIVFPINETKSNTNQYLVCEVLVCLLPEMQDSNYLGNGLLKVLDNYHCHNPLVNVVIFDSMINYRSYKTAIRSKSAIPSPHCESNPVIENFIAYLRDYFGYKLVDDNPYTVRTISDLKVKISPQSNDAEGNFFVAKTQQRSHVGLLTLSCFYLVEGNTLRLPAQSRWPYDETYPVMKKLEYNKYENNDQYGPDKYAAAVFNGKLYVLTQILKKEALNLVPKLHNLSKLDMQRTSILWHYYFNKGIFLSSGGVEESFIKHSELHNNHNLAQYSTYRSDRSESTLVTQPDMKKFLIEENSISADVGDALTYSFCMGSHEGAMRVLRCIYKSGKNDGIFFAYGSYGFVAAGAAVMKPVPYNVHLIKIDRNNGEKILIEDLKNLIKQHPTAKSLCLDLKTTSGAVYTEQEIKEIIAVCKKHSIFTIFDAAHTNMELNPNSKFPNVAKLCLSQNYHEFAIVFTGSKTYGLERARVGIVVLSKNSRIAIFWIKMEVDLYRVHGSLGDLSFEVAHLLFTSSVDARQKYLSDAINKHFFNMNLMLAYIEGIDSPSIASELRQAILAELLPQYRQGIKGMRVVHKPESGIQMKVELCGLENKYFTNIKMFNSEVFAYSFNKMFGIIVLNSYQILDPKGLGLRLSFSAKCDIHAGMMAMHDFVNLLTDKPTLNIFLPHISNIEEIILSAKDIKIKNDITNSYTKIMKPDLLMNTYKMNVRKLTPSSVNLSDEQLCSAVNSAAALIQRAWKGQYVSTKYVSTKLEGQPETSLPRPKL